MKKLSTIKIVIAVLAIIIALTGMFLYFIISPYYDNSIDIVEASTSTEDPSVDIELEQTDDVSNIENNAKDNIIKEEQKADEIFNVVLSGVDTRSYDLNSRSDTIILASYNRTKRTIKLVSFMRDSWVHLPDRGWSRINTATVYGGTGLLINTLNKNFDLDIQNYIQVKFDDFKTIIDALGGIEVELSQSEINYINKKLHTEDRDWSNDIKDKPGVINLNGAQALWHCRNRTIGNSDFERTERQREVLSLLIEKAIHMDAAQAMRLVFELKDSVNTNIPIMTLAQLLYDAVIVGDITVETARVPFDNEFNFANKNGASVLEIDIDDNTKLLHDFLGYDSANDKENSTDVEEEVNNGGNVEETAGSR